jgi:hypothetical protein
MTGPLRNRRGTFLFWLVYLFLQAAAMAVH